MALCAEQARLARRQARLQQIEREGPIPAYEVVLKRIPPQWVAGIRTTLPDYDRIGALFAELHTFVASQRKSASRPPAMALYYDPGYRERDVDVEAAIGVQKALSSTPRVTVRTLPGSETMACVVHQGRRGRIVDAYSSLMQWIDSSGYRAVGVNRELYWQGPGSDTEQDMERH